MNRLFTIAVVLTGVVAAGVGCNRRAAEIAPPAIQLGQSVCDSCGMIISDDHYASALIVQDDDELKPLKFDDMGCMLRYEREHPSDVVRGRYVKDLSNGNWLAADAATFVHGGEVSSPMGYRIGAVANKGTAQKLSADRNARVCDLEQLKKAQTEAVARKLAD